MVVRATKEITMRPAKAREQEEAPETFSQRKRPAIGRYALQVDRQVKQTFVDLEAAKEAGAVIKKSFPIVQVAVYDTIDLTGIPIENA